MADVSTRVVGILLEPPIYAEGPTRHRGRGGAAV